MKKLAYFLIVPLFLFSVSAHAQKEINIDSATVILLNAIDVPVGSVRVYACSELLTENKDYKVDYIMGRVTINPEIMQGAVIKIEMESKPTVNRTAPNNPTASKPQKDYSLWDWEQAVK